MVSTDTDELLDKWSTEFRKGFAKPLILLMLRNGENYPYRLTREISEHTKGAINIQGSNIYPLLGSMRKRGLVASQKQEAEDSERVRTIYTLTPLGVEYLNALSAEIIDFLQIMLALIKEGEK